MLTQRLICLVAERRREGSSADHLKIIHTPTGEMIADMLTKPIQGIQFIKLRRLLMSCD